MIHLPQLIQDLGIILVTAAVVTIVFKKLKQPVVLGYLIAGLLLGPHIPFMPTIKDTTAVKIWAEIGVIILLFGLGLEFSFKKLAKVGRSATVTALFEVVFMLALGYASGRVLGWGRMDSLFLGGILSVSSTTIIVRAFDELGLKSRHFVSLVFGVLVVEDVVAILLLVLLSTVAISQSLSGSELLFSSVRLGFFLILWFVLGIYLLPTFINRIRHLLSDETAIVVSLGLCLLMVIIATYAGFSPALGAFVMGTLLSETKEGERIEKLIHPVRDLFAAVFFVSVGMLIEPQYIMDYKFEILFITLVTLVGKFLGSALGSLLSGASVRHSVQVGMSLAQIGEFSFIIATLGLTLNVTNAFLYPIAVAVSAITTFTTPYMIRSADVFCNWIEKKMPVKGKNLFLKYQAAMQSQSGQKSFGQLVWQAFGWRILLNTIVVIAIFLFAEKFVLGFIMNFFGPGFFSSLLLTVMALAAAAPFLWAISFGEPNLEFDTQDVVHLEKLMFGVRLVRGLFALNLVAFFINGFLTINSFAGLIVFLVFAVLLAVGSFSNRVYSKIESRFISNLEAKANDEKNAKAKMTAMTPWDVGLVEFVVDPHSRLVGSTLLNAKLRENYGVTITMVQRGEIEYVAPDRNWIIMPFDKLYIIGSDEQLEKVKSALERKIDINSEDLDFNRFGLKSIRLREPSDLIGKVIRESGIRDSISGMIVGIERNGERVLSPDSAMILQDDDLIWVVGDVEKIKRLT